MDESNYLKTEKRVFERLPCNFKVEFRSHPRSLGEALGYDFSAEGLGISSKQAVPLGEEVELGIHFSKDLGPLSIKAKVIWMRQEASGLWRMGLRLDHLHIYKFLPLIVHS